MSAAHLDWTLMRAFALVARHGSLSQAAQAGAVSQPTLSRHIAELERRLAVTLFERRSTGLALTGTGTALQAHAETMAEAADRFSLAATGQSSAIAGTVRLTASEMTSAYLLPPPLTELKCLEPQIDIELDANNRSGNLLRREADIAIRMYRPVQADLVTCHLGDHQLGAYATPGYLARMGTPVVIDDLDHHDIVGLDTDEFTIAGFRLAGKNVDRSFFSFRSDSMVVGWQMVRSGYGIGFVNQAIGAADPSVVRLFSNVNVGCLPLWLTAHAELRTSARIKRVFDFLAARLK